MPLKPYQRVRTASVGWWFVSTRRLRKNIWRVKSGKLYGTTAKVNEVFPRFKPVRIFGINSKKGFLWLDVDGVGHGISFDDARALGGVFRSDFEAAVFAATKKQ